MLQYAGKIKAVLARKRPNDYCFIPSWNTCSRRNMKNLRERQGGKFNLGSHWRKDSLLYPMKQIHFLSRVNDTFSKHIKSKQCSSVQGHRQQWVFSVSVKPGSREPVHHEIFIFMALGLPCIILGPLIYLLQRIFKVWEIPQHPLHSVKMKAVFHWTSPLWS